MSIDEPLLETSIIKLPKQQQHETNGNTNNISDTSVSPVSSTDSSTSSESNSNKQTTDSTTTTSTDSGNLSDTVKDSVPKLAKNALPSAPAKAPLDGSDLNNCHIQVVETFKQKKKNLTLQLTASPGSELSSMSSTDSNSKNFLGNHVTVNLKL